jgi:hypothetical protein
LTTTPLGCKLRACGFYIITLTLKVWFLPLTVRAKFFFVLAFLFFICLMMISPSLFIFFLETLKATAFLILQLPHNADWLWQKTQAEKKKPKKF